MKQGFKLGLPAVLALGLLVPALQAQTFGRLELKIITQDGTPVQDVEVTITRDDMASFRQEKKTNKKGVVVASLVDATRVYLFTIKHADYPEIRQYLKADLGTTKKVEIVLDEGATEQGREGEDPIVEFTKAEETFNEGVVAIQSGDTVLAHQKFLEALELDRDLIIVHAALARVYASQEEWEKAIASVDTFFASEGSDPGLYRVLYEAHTALGDESAAKKAIDQLSGSGSKDDAAAMLYNEGVAAFRIGDDAEAATRFNEALGILPDLAAALKALAVVRNRQGDLAGAVEAAERYLAVEPEDATVLEIRWRAYRGLGDEAKLAEARAALVAVDATPLAEELYQHGRELFQAGNTAEAAEEFRAALELVPDHPRAHYQLGLSYLSLDSSDEAKTHLERFLELAPDDPEAPSAKEMLSYLE